MIKVYCNFFKNALFILFFILSGSFLMGVSAQDIEVEPSPTPCELDVQCGFSAINNYFISMGTQPYTGNYPDAPQGGCGVDNPNWFAFVAGGGNVTMTIDVKNCSQGGSGPGVQLTVYRGDPQCTISGSYITVTGLEYIAGQCQPAMAPGTYTYTFNTTPGYTYYMLLDGFGSSLCDAAIRIEQGGDPPILDETIKPEEVNIPEFQGPDTLCLGANEYFFCAEDLPIGAAYALWALPNGDTIRSEIGSPCVLLTEVFDVEGEFELCVAAASDCDESPYACRTYYVKPLQTLTDEDEICKGESYSWPYAQIGAENLSPGTHQFEAYVEASTGGCMQKHELNLVVKPTNEDQPTVIDTIICLDDSYFFDVNPTTSENFFTDLPVTDAEYIDKSLLSGCDTFFNITVEVIGGEFVVLPPECNGIGQLMFTFDFFEIVGNTIPLYDPRLTVIYEWYIEGQKVGEGEFLSLNQADLENYGEFGLFGVYLQVTIFYGDQLQYSCFFQSAPYSVNKENWVPEIVDVTGPESICPESEAFYDIDINFSPASPDDIIINMVVYTPTNVYADEDIANNRFSLYAAPGAQSGQVCVWIRTACGFDAEYCFQIDIMDLPEPDVGEDREECENTFTLVANQAANGRWTTGSIPSSASVSFEDKDAPTTEVEVDKYGFYTFIWTEGVPGCQKQDSLVIEYVQGPRLEGSARYECNPEQTGYTVQFSIVGGTKPYSVTSDNGTIESDSVFVSELFDSESEHTIQLVDANGCGPLKVEVTFVCDCENEAGTMSQEVIELCADEDAQAVYNDDGSLREDDAEEFVLHDGSGNVLGTIYDRNSTGEFSFQAGMDYGETYYISHLVGLEDDGEVDTDDKCLQVSPGQPVVWYAYPVADAGGDTTACGYSYELEASPSSGKWELVEGDGNATFEDKDDRRSLVTVDEVGDYTFRWVANNHGCRDTSEVIISFVGDLKVASRVIECSSDKTEYRYTIEVSGGSGNYEIDDSGVSGTVNGSTIVTDWVDAEQDVVLIVYDDLGCGPLEVNLAAECDCESDVGTMLVGEILTACENGGCVQVSYDSEGEYQDDNDSYMYILHTEESPQIGTVISWNQSGEFCFEQGMDAGETYYVSYVVGNEISNGEVDLTDQCLAITASQPVLFNVQPVATVMNDTTSCSTEIMLSAVFSTTGSTGEWTILSQPAGSGSVTIASEEAEETLATLDGTPGEYCFQWEETNGECSDVTEVCITLYEAPRVWNSTIEHICNSDGMTYYVEFTIEGGDSDSYKVEGNTGTLTGNHFSSDNIEKDSVYVFYIFDENACDTIVLTNSHSCECITEAGSIDAEDTELCEDEPLVVSYSGDVSSADADIHEFILKDDAGVIVQRNRNGEFSFDVNQMNLGEGYNVRAYLGFPDGNQVDLTDGCLDSSNVIKVTWHAYPEVLITSEEDMITCTVQEIMLDASGSTPMTGVTYTWEALENGSIKSGDENSPRPIVTSGGLYRVTVRHELSGCESEGEIRIDQSDDVPEIVVDDYGKLTCAVTSIMLNTSQSSQGATIITRWEDPAGNEIEDADPYLLEVTEAGVYTFTLIDTSSDCEISKTITVNEDKDAPDAVASVDDMIGCSVTEVTVSGSGSSSGSQYSYSWTTTDGEILGSANGLEIRVTAAGTYELTVTNRDNGCTSVARVEVENNPIELSEVEVSLSGLECEGGSLGTIQVTALNGLPPYEYRLSNGQKNNNGVFADLEVGEYTLEVEDAIGCIVVKEIELTEPQAFDAQFIDDIRINEGESVVIHFASVSPGLSQVIWGVDGDFTCLSVDGVCDSILVQDIESQVITATLINEFGCVIERSIQVIVLKDRKVYIPTAFSPNGDGVNDFFTIGMTEKVEEILELEIYDRWGTRVYILKDTPVPGVEIDTWNGTYKDQPLSPNVYMYRLKVRFEDGEELQFRGSVNLLR